MSVVENSSTNYDQSEPPYEPPVRPIWRFLLAAIYAFGVNWLAARVVYSSGLTRHPLVSDLAWRAIAALMLFAGFHFMVRVLDEYEGNAWTYLGLPFRAVAIRDTIIGLAIGGGLVTAAFSAMYALGGIRAVHFDHSAAAIRKLIEVAVLFIVGAMLEEVMFRGYPFQRLVEGIGAVGAIVFFSAMFAWGHLDNPNSGGIASWGFFNTIAVGVLFAVAYLRTGSLWLPFGMHFGWNFFLGAVFGLPVSGISDFAVVVRSTTRNGILTGGSYGLEGSLTGACVILLGFLPVLWFTRNRHYEISKLPNSGTSVVKSL